MSTPQKLELAHGPEKRYATALFELAQEGKQLAAIAQEMRALQTALAEVPEFATALANPLMEGQAQRKLVQALVKELKASKLTQQFLETVQANGRLSLLPGIVWQVLDMIATANGEVTAHVTAATTLTQTQQTALTKLVKELVPSAKQVNLTTQQDEKLLGGFVLDVASQQVDASVRGQLQNFQNQLTQTKA